MSKKSTSTAVTAMPKKTIALQLDWFERGIIEARANLNRYAVDLYRDPVAAEDAVQETLYRALANRNSFSKDTNLVAWLRKIMLNRFREERRRSSAKNHCSKDEPGYVDSRVAADDPERSLMLVEMWHEVVRLQKIADVLVAAGLGCSLEEMSQKFGIPVNTVKSHLFRGRARLVELTGGF